MDLTLEELNLIRQWFNAVEDVTPEYLEKADRELVEKIKAALTATTSHKAEPR